MSRWLWPWSNCVKERVCRYLLHHYLGHFFQEHLSLDQLSLDLYKGSVALRDIHLEIWSVNEVLESMESPLELVEGFVSSIEVAVPWAALLTDHCTVCVTGLQLTLQPHRGPGPGAADSQSWASCMTTSLQLAQECLRDGLPEPSEPPQPLEGLEMFAQTIETVLRRIKVTFLDTVVRVEHSSGDGEHGVALEIHVQRLEYCDEAVRDPSQAPPVDVHQPPAFLHKLLQLAGVRLHFEELPPQEEPPEPPLQIGSCSGYMELMVKLKQNEAFPGPKLEVAGQLGSLHLLLSPRQLQQLQELFNAMSLADTEGLTDKLNKSRPLGAEDLWLIEQDLNQQLQAGAVAEPFSPDPLINPPLNLDSTDLFFSMAGLTSSATSALSELSLSDVDLGSSVHSNVTSHRLSAQAHPAGKAAPTPLPDTMRPDSLLKMTLGGVTVTLLQTSAPSSGPPDLPTHFFAEFDATKEGPFGSRDFHHLRPRFQRACPQSHVRLTGTAVQLSWELRAGGRGRRTASTEVHFGQLEVLECLWPSGTSEPEYTELLSFPSNLGSQASARPCAHLRHTQTLRRVPKSRPRRSVACQCHSELTLDLADFQADVDLGALDRLTALLRLATTPPEPPASLLTEPPPAMEQRTVFRLTAPQATLRLRFPIADLRPERDPWAGRAGRAEQLRLELSEPQFRSELSSGPGPPAPTRLELTCSDLHGVYEDGEKPPVPCLRVSKALDPKSIGHKYFLPQVVVTLNPQSSSAHWEVAPEKGEELEMSAESPCELREPEPSPFSSKRTMYETEEMVIPGDPEEMRTFQNRTLALSRCSVEVVLPGAHIFLPSKEVYESLYNRINNDLLMWEPADLLPTPDLTTHPPGFPGPSGFWHDNFKMCKSAFKLDSDSDDEDAHFFSVGTSAAPQAPVPEPPTPHSQSTFSTLVTVLKGRITALCEAKDEGGRRLEAMHGELVLDVEHGTLFSVSQYRGQPGLGYFCLEAEKAALYHQAAVDDYLLPSHLELPSFAPPTQLAPTIYPSEEGLTGRGSSGRKGQGPGPQMLSTAVRIHLDPHKNVKEFLVTLRLHKATLRHYMALPEQSWHSQLLEFLDVLDDPVLGYLPPTVITVLHTHLFSCAVDYRPLYLPVRVLVTAETFTLSSNIIMDTSTFLLRFILDDSALYLSDKCEVETLDLRRDYVCVLDVDLLELVIKTWKGSTEGRLSQPLFELRCSNNVVHVHSCADSCALLANLLQYVMSAGDLHPPPRPPSPTEIAGQKVQLSESPASLPSCPPVETALINQRDLADALLDTERSLRELAQPSGGPLPQASPVSVYLFPGERSGAQAPSPPAGGPSDSSGSRSEAKEEEKEEEGDGDALDSDEFCILDAPGLGIPPRDGEPVVTQLHPGPIVVRDGHFSRPLGSTDLLRAPAHFPVPSSRVVLREVSLVWHLYGGRDFGPHPGHRARVGLTGPRGSPSRCSGPNRPQNSWRTQGGSGRQHHVLMEIQLSKVSFQHEVYPAEPASGPAAPGKELEERPLSRQVFIVQELEVRDRLASSQINKFLYLHTSERMPRRAHSNMLTIKALHVAPTTNPGGPECCLRVSLMPLRLNVDQDALFFLKDFFTSLAAGINPMVSGETPTEARPETQAQHSSPQEGQPEGLETTASQEAAGSGHSPSAEQQPIYFREFRFTSEVPIWLDYHGKHVTMDQVGTFAGLLIGLAQLNCSELKLKRLCCRHGLLGVDKVLGYALNEWLQDIRKNQLPGLLGGVGPMHSVVQLFQGFRDLLWLPIEQYRKDGRLMRGLQRGAASFGSSTASAALELSNRLVQAIQATAETVYDILSPAAPISRSLQDKRSARRLRRGQQPADLREGVAKAYDTVREGILDTAQTICDVASRGHEQKGLTGAVGGVIRQLPPTVVKPLILATEATSNLLGGMRNQILPDAHKDHALKWRSEEAQD
ncbi:autophagy-related protein 2 homolog A isoform X1 [Tupaia chinensis]|uniref:autophagy-related protein 2 homolog A isoform X1 n=1 Tax=Tupaia chinensis TaxID=246437 RepID=UPI000FFB5F27|nr:autophagy-related protein 2 homolog A isoform X1 [Tupaia chinensis]XP_027628219.1 autophagy-related protein 2 homolog A isoform X1 [Tupaia chinensis]